MSHGRTGAATGGQTGQPPQLPQIPHVGMRRRGGAPVTGTVAEQAAPGSRTQRRPAAHEPSRTVVCARLLVLLLVGLVFHGFMLFAVFDTYFISPVLHGMPAVTIGDDAGTPPARRAVFIVGTCGATPPRSLLVVGAADACMSVCGTQPTGCGPTRCTRRCQAPTRPR